VAVLREADGCRWASPPLEIHANGVFDTQSKYDGSARFSVPTDLGSADQAALTGAALRMFDALGCAGPPASTSSSPITDLSSTRSTPCRE
jgi:D-alanine-D-alanine ligase